MNRDTLEIQIHHLLHPVPPAFLLNDSDGRIYGEVRRTNQFILSISFHHGFPYSYHLGDEQ
jgi:hypothetical protein